MWSVLVGRFPHLFRDSPPTLYHPDIVTAVWSVSPRSLALSQLTLAVLSLSALEIIHDPGHGSLFIFSYWIDVDRLFFRISLYHLNKFVLHSLFFLVPVAPLRPSIREGDFLASIRPEVRVSSMPALQDSWALLWLVSVGMLPVHSPVLFDCCLPSVVHLGCSGLSVGSVPRDSTFRVPVRCGPRLLGGPWP